MTFLNKVLILVLFVSVPALVLWAQVKEETRDPMEIIKADEIKITIETFGCFGGSK